MLQLETISDAYSFHSYDSHSAKIIKPKTNIHSNQPIEDALLEISSTTLIFKDHLESNAYPDTFAKFDIHCLNKMIQHKSELYLIGTGQNGACFPEREISKYIAQEKIPIDFMTSDAACRTFNILTGEYREVAILIFFK